MTKKKDFINALGKLSITQLYEELRSLKREIFNLRLKKIYGELKNVNHFRFIRKKIARIYTYINKKSIVSSEN